MWMGSRWRWAAEAGPEGAALLWHCPLGMPFWPALWHALACTQALCLSPCPCKPALQGPGGPCNGWQHDTTAESDPMVWGTTPATQGRPTSSEKGITSLSCSREFLQFAACPPFHAALSQPFTYIPAWTMAVTWITSCPGPPQGWEVIHHCPCIGMQVVRGRKARPGSRKGQGQIFSAEKWWVGRCCHA